MACCRIVEQPQAAGAEEERDASTHTHTHQLRRAQRHTFLVTPPLLYHCSCRQNR